MRDAGRMRISAVAVVVSVLGGAAMSVAAARPGPVATGSIPATRGTSVVVGSSGGGSLRFGGTGVDDIDRVKIPLSASTPVNVGLDLTIEFFLRGRRVDNAGSGCAQSDTGWITGNIVIDRDVYGPGDRGDFGISLSDGRVAFGASRGTDGATVCGATDVLDGDWHHVAATRRASDGRLQVYVDGELDGEIASSGAVGDISYRVGRNTEWPASDPYLVFGAEKHDAGSEYPSFAGLLDEVRISTVIRYADRFVPPRQPFTVDASTAALYHLDDTGSTARDARGASPGVIRRTAPGATPEATPDEPW